MMFRTDRAQLRAPVRTVSSATFEGVAARVHGSGDGLTYPWGTEYRDLAELRRIVDQLRGKPVVLGHPTNATKTVDKTTPIAGHVIEARIDGTHAIVRFEVHSDIALRAIDHGTRELSLGYWAGSDSIGYQRETDVDHLAIVDAARCGAACALRADGCGCGGACGSTTCTNRAPLWLEPLPNSYEAKLTEDERALPAWRRPLPNDPRLKRR